MVFYWPKLGLQRDFIRWLRHQFPYTSANLAGGLRKILVFWVAGDARGLLSFATGKVRAFSRPCYVNFYLSSYWEYR
jgi:hypothetical protein